MKFLYYPGNQKLLYGKYTIVTDISFEPQMSTEIEDHKLNKERTVNCNGPFVFKNCVEYTYSIICLFPKTQTFVVIVLQSL